jgi:hypothetical protein
MSLVKLFYIGNSADGYEKRGIPVNSQMPIPKEGDEIINVLEIDSDVYSSEGLKPDDFEWTSVEIIDIEGAKNTKDLEEKEIKKSCLLDACTQYQQGEAKPRIDSNFFSLLMASQTVKKMNPEFTCACCDANIVWNNVLWADYEQRKADIDNGLDLNCDFSNNENPPHTWDECHAELS